jgi:AcrR family transcriptional regulator
MGRETPKSKGTRPYDRSGRQEGARQRQTAALDIARGLFLVNGYSATTVESIARAASISPATIYKSYGGKSGLVRALCEQALAGAGPAPAEERSDALRSGSDPGLVLEGWGRLTAEVSPLISPLLLLLRSAAQTDPEAAAIRAELDRDRLTRMTENARYLSDGGHLRSGVSAHDARDVLWLCSSPELFDLLIKQRRWTKAKYRRFIIDTMTSALL